VKVDRQRIGTVNVLAPQGPLTDDDADQFSALLLEELSAANPRVVVSLEGVPYVDSSALSGLVACADDLIARGSRLKLTSVPATCREIFELTGLTRRFQFFEDEDTAVRSFL
jgi:anti-anti-sigma factor